MAEIKIKKKKPVWPWIILVLIILVILYFLFFDNGNNTIDGMDNMETEQIDTIILSNDIQSDTINWDTEMTDTITNGGVSGYVTYIADTAQMGVDHEYTNNALLYLIDAIDEKASELNVDISSDMQEVREDAREITQNPEATNHAGHIKDAGTNIVNVLEELQQENFPDLSQQVETLKASVEEIDPSVETLQQKDKINTFFNEAANILQQMNQ